MHLHKNKKNRTVYRLSTVLRKKINFTFIHSSFIHYFMSFYHALGARLGRFRNYVTAQPIQVTISSVLVFPVFFLFLYTVWNS